MVYTAVRDGRSLLGGSEPAVAVVDAGPEPAGDVSGSISPITLLPPVLGRLARALAAAARFSLDRFSDVYLVTDAIGALLDSDAAGERVRFVLVGRDRRLELRIGPLTEGCTERVRALEGGGARLSPLASLTDSLEGEPGPGGGPRHSGPSCSTAATRRSAGAWSPRDAGSCGMGGPRFRLRGKVETWLL